MIPSLKLATVLPVPVKKYLDSLSKCFAGDIHVDSVTRLVSSVDNSVYQVVPAAILFPQHQQDLVNIFSTASVCQYEGLSFTVRGGNTSTNGQSLGAGIIIDCSKYLNQIQEINTDEGWVRVQPGVVPDELNRQLASRGYFFPIIISTSNRCTLGGNAATNACGKGSTFYGSMLDVILELHSVLADGTLIQTSELSHTALQALAQQSGRLGSICRQVADLIVEYGEEIEKSYPKLARTVSGYTLHRVISETGFNLNPILIGSEGTLGVFTELKLKIFPLVKYKKLVVLQYADFQSALEDGARLVQAQPQAIETMDDHLIEIIESEESDEVIKGYFINPKTKVHGITLVEFASHEPALIDQQIIKLKNILQDDTPLQRLAIHVVEDAPTIKSLWTLRQKSVGLLGCLKGARKPVSGIEDTLVPTKVLPQYAQALGKLLRSAGVEYAMFGHIDAGCLHVRPALDLSDPHDEALYYALSDQVVKLVKKYCGIMWGEHGKGFRSQYVPEIFGAELFAVLCKIKKIFDPHNVLNPGKIATSRGQAQDLLAIDAVSIRGARDRQIYPSLKKQYNAVMACNGNGECFTADQSNTMCPSFKVSHDRVHSPKGRATVLREWLRLLSQHPNSSAKIKKWRSFNKHDFSHVVFDALHGCLECGACIRQCPVHVNIPKSKAEFLQQYYSRYYRSIRCFFMVRVETIIFWQSLMPRWFKFLFYNTWSVTGFKKIVGLIDLPKPQEPSLADQLRQRGIKTYHAEQVVNLADKKKVVIVMDMMTLCYEPDLITAYYDLLKLLDYHVVILKYQPTGKAYYTQGKLHAFRKRAEKNLWRFKPLEDAGIPMLGIDPAMTLVYRQEYAEFSAPIAVQLIQEWLCQQNIKWPTVAFKDKKIILFMHCTEQSTVSDSTAKWLKIFEQLNLNVELAHTGCCGMAGTYGYQVERQAYSRALFSMSWRPYLNKGNILLASGFSCRVQIRRLTDYPVFHPVEFLLKILNQGAA